MERVAQSWAKRPRNRSASRCGIAPREAPKACRSGGFVVLRRVASFWSARLPKAKVAGSSPVVRFAEGPANLPFWPTAWRTRRDRRAPSLARLLPALLIVAGARAQAGAWGGEDMRT